MAKRKFKKRTPYQKLKKDVWKLCSYYIRLRDSIEYARKYNLPLDTRICQCYTCAKVYDVKKMHAGHFKSRKSGGSSGIYFDERGIHTQCTQCNTFEQGRPTEYKEHLVKEYGPEIIEILELKHKTDSYKMADLTGLKVYFELEVNRLLKESEIQKWW